jgi:hypothetical protein
MIGRTKAALVPQAPSEQIKEFLLAWSGGNQDAFARVELVYPELRKIARTV